MNALMLDSYNELSIRDVPTPDINPHELLVRIHAAGICGSDVHGYDGSSGRRIPPVIMGHEASGVVESVGEQVAGFRPGDRITFDSTVFCGNCPPCRRGEVNLCENRQVLGVSCDEYRRHGAFAEYVAIPERIAYHIPDEVTFHQAAMVEPVSIAVHAVSITPLPLGGTAVVVGAGMIGLLTLQAVRAAGAARVMVTDISKDKLDMARKLGADVTVDVSAGDAVRAVRDMTDGRGADVVLDAVGSPASVRGAVDLVRPGGTVTLIGNIASEVNLPLQYLVTRQIRLQGSCASAGEYPACLALLASGDIDVTSLISAVAPLEDGAQWFGRLHDAEPGLIKVILEP